jgi:hypothetical protein
MNHYTHATRATAAPLGDLPPILSFGAGVNSVALAILAVNDGWRGEIVFADTGCENPETYCWIAYFEREFLQPRGLSVTRLQGLPWQRYALAPAGPGCSLIEYCEAGTVAPMAAARWCTSEWKVLPIERYGKGRPTMIGIAADEAHRQKGRCCPLVDRGIDRAECVRIIEHAGLDVPQKSGCYICPFQRASQWRELWRRHPDLYARAMRLEDAIARKRGFDAALSVNGKITLRQRLLSFESQMELPEVDMDELRQYQPCVCTL